MHEQPTSRDQAPSSAQPAETFRALVETAEQAAQVLIDWQVEQGGIPTIPAHGLTEETGGDSERSAATRMAQRAGSGRACRGDPREFLASALSTKDTLVAMRSLFLGFVLGVLFALPWIVAAVWISWRAGWRAPSSENGKAVTTQATSLRSFRLG